MPTIPEALSQAVSYHQAGQLPQAEQLYRQVLQADPQQAPAWHLLGVLAHQVGNNDVAIDYIGRAIALNPFVGEFHYNLGTVYQAAGRAAQAVPCFRQALQFEPNGVNALTNLGKALEELDQFEEAIAVYHSALRLAPNSAKLHYNLGIALRRQGKPEAAVTFYRRAVELDPNMALAHNNLGAVLQKQGAFDEAVACFRKALALVPDYAEAFNNLGKAYHDRADWVEAEPCYRRALELQPNFATAHSNLGKTLHDQHRWAEAEACYRRAVELQPDLADTHNNLAMLYLIQARWTPGWDEYEWRWRTEQLVPRGFREPVWQGEPLAGKTILLHAEQGFGDTLQFIRYARLVKNRGGTVIVECQRALLPLLQSCAGVDRWVAAGEPLPRYDVQCPLLSLPRVFQTTMATIPADIPYLSARAELVQRWRERLACHTGFRIGICWQGNPTQGDQRRFMPLRRFATVAAVPGSCMLSLQKGAGREQLAELDGAFSVTDLGTNLDEEAGAFMDTAAVMMNLDLVITPDTAIGHVAGALGVPVWILLPFVPDWRWLIDRDDSPWYPTARLFRQQQPGEWNDVFAHMTEALRQHLALSAVRSPR